MQISMNIVNGLKSNN